jgi:cobalt/nickel transport system permease protein
MISLDETFAAGNSVIHRMDPRVRFGFACFFSVGIAVMDNFSALFPALAAAFLLTGIAKLRLTAVLKRLTVVVGFLILIWLMLPLTYEGEAIARIWKLNVYREGLLLSARISLKSLTILMIFMTLVTTMTVNTLGHVLYFFRLPAKLVFLLLITYRYIFVIGGEYYRLRTAMRVRCFKSRTNMHSFRSIAYLVGMLFVRCSLRAERVSQAMKLRGFDGRFYSLEDFHAYKKSFFICALLAVILGTLIALEWFLQIELQGLFHV